ncbi:MAG TPA: hypothetical protein VEZ12_11605, partial [Herpetosiphonaceae bacterium]|nr:hypothetical protein [Herpetosiphonaceae bacterium]
MTTIGIPRESREGETRVGMTPSGVRQLTAAGHQVFVERGAGERAGFTDLLYMEAGAQLVYSPEEAYWRSELIVKVARPTDGELELLKDGTTLLSFLHLASARVSKIELLLRKRILAI